MAIEEMLGRIPTKLLLIAITLYSYGESTVATVLSLFNRLMIAYNALFRPDYYIFFEDSAHPYPFYSTHYWATGSAAPELMYRADTKLFFPWIPRNPEEPGKGISFDDICVEERYKALPLLSIEFIDEHGQCAYDLTDFIESMRYVALEGFAVPSLYHIVSAWSISSGIVPDHTRFTIRYFDSNGDTHILGEDNEGGPDSEETVTEEAAAATEAAATETPKAEDTPAPEAQETVTEALAPVAEESPATDSKEETPETKEEEAPAPAAQT